MHALSGVVEDNHNDYFGVRISSDNEMTRRILVLACLSVVVLGGCTVAVDNGDSGDAGAIVDRVESELQATETLEATMIATIEEGNTTITERVRLRYERPQHYNLTYLEVTNGTGDRLPNATGDAVIANGTQLWGYDDATQQVVWYNETRPRSLSELLMPSTQFGQNVTFAGNETITGDDASKLSYAIDGSKVSLISGDVERRSRLSSAMNESTPVNATVWIDRDRWLPIKTRLTMRAAGNPVTVTYRYEDIERGIEIPAGTFEPPADATRTDLWEPLEEQFAEHNSVEAVNGEASPPITEPTVPKHFTFEWGNVTTTNGAEQVLLFYQRDTTDLRLARWDNTSIGKLQGGTSVSLGSVEGTYTELSERRLVGWTCGEHRYLVSTRANQTIAMETARSVAC